MQRPSPSSFRIPRWLLWSLAPVAMAALLSTSIDLVQAGTGDSAARQHQSSTDARRADAAPAEAAPQR